MPSADVDCVTRADTLEDHRKKKRTGMHNMMVSRNLVRTDLFFSLVFFENNCIFLLVISHQATAFSFGFAIASKVSREESLGRPEPSFNWLLVTGH